MLRSPRGGVGAACDSQACSIQFIYIAFITSLLAVARLLDHKIILLRLPPHTSYLLQPLDSGKFQPLNKYLLAELGRSIRTQVSRIQKAEWVKAYVQARTAMITSDNL